MSEEQPDNVARYERWGKWAAAVAFVCYVVIWWFDRHELFGPLGDAMGPLTGVLTALALFAAIEGVKLQREELKLQRQELAESREVMKEQAEAAKETAKVQARLADAQEALAEAQREANGLIWRDQNLRFVQDITELDTRVAEVSYERNSGLKVTPHPEFEKLIKIYQARRAVLLEAAETLSRPASSDREGPHTPSRDLHDGRKDNSPAGE